MAAPQQEPAATEPSRRRRWHGAVQQAGSTPFLHPQKGLYPETAFDRRPEDACPVPRLLRIGGALQSAFGLDEGLLTPPLAMTAVPLALHSSRGRVCVLGSSPEVLPPAAHTSPEQMGEVEVVRPPLRREQLRGAKTPRARRGRRAGTPLPLCPHPPWTHICFVPKRSSPMAQKPVVAPRNATCGNDSHTARDGNPQVPGRLPKPSIAVSPPLHHPSPHPPPRNKHPLQPPPLFGPRTPQSPRPFRRDGGGHWWLLPSSSLAGVSPPAPLPTGRARCPWSRTLTPSHGPVAEEVSGSPTPGCSAHPEPRL